MSIRLTISRQPHSFWMPPGRWWRNWPRPILLSSTSLALRRSRCTPIRPPMERPRSSAPLLTCSTSISALFRTLLGVRRPCRGNNTPTENFATRVPRPNTGSQLRFLPCRAGNGQARPGIHLPSAGVTEMDDMAEGTALWDRPYFDKTTGIRWHLYGGYTSAMEILRHPDVLMAASASSPPTLLQLHFEPGTSVTCGSPRGTKRATKPVAP